jgi:CHAD domain-containing protein
VLGLSAQARTAGRHDGLTAHIRATLDVQLRVLLAEQATAGDADAPESVHQMRVATRRARVALRMDRGGIEKAGWLRDELAWLGTLLGEVRDLDVLCERLGEDGAALPEHDLPAFGDVLSVLLADRVAAADALVTALHRPRYRTLLRALATEATAERPADSDAPGDLLLRPVRTLHQQLAASALSPSDETWHTLRIRVKRVRYAAELAGRLAGRARRAELAELVEQAKTAQEVLGAFQDTVVAEHRLRQLVATRPDGLSPAGWVVLGRLIERQSARGDALREKLPAACGDLYRLTTKPGPAKPAS